MCLKKYYLLLLLLLLLSPLLFSDVLLTDSEYQEIQTALSDSETALTNQKESEKKLQAELTQLKTLQQISDRITEQQAKELELLRKSLKEQRKEQTITRILDHLRGFVGGYFVNENQDNK